MIHIVNRISILPDQLLHSVLSLCTLPVCNLITKLFQLYSFAVYRFSGFNSIENFLMDIKNFYIFSS